MIFNKPALFVQKLVYCGPEGILTRWGVPPGSPFRPLKMRQKQPIGGDYNGAGKLRLMPSPPPKEGEARSPAYCK